MIDVDLAILRYLFSRKETTNKINIDDMSSILNINHNIILKKLKKYLDYIEIYGNQYFSIITDKKVEFAIEAIKLGLSLDIVTRFLSWHDFEIFLTKILEYNDFLTITNFYFTANKKRREIDVIGYRKGILLCIEAKHWLSKNLSHGVLRKIVEAHIERITLLQQSLDSLRKYGILQHEKTVLLLPLVITLYHHDHIFSINKVPIISSNKFNDFLVNGDFYSEELYSVKIELNKTLLQF